jgi:hypothetical protein
MPLVSRPLDAGVRGEFDFPLEVTAAAATGHAALADAEHVRTRCYEVTVPVSFRATKGNADDVQQLEIELTFGGHEILVLGFEPRTTLAGDVVGEIEETVTTEESNSFDAAVGASVPIPGLKVAQIGPSVNASDSDRTVRTQKIRRRPQLSTVVVAGSTARGRGVFFQLRPAPDVSLEGAHHLTLHIAVPVELQFASIDVKCRAMATEDWLLFERDSRIAAANGQVKVELTPVAARDGITLHAAERPCPWCHPDP